jgi:hypothetical protein
MAMKFGGQACKALALSALKDAEPLRRRFYPVLIITISLFMAVSGRANGGTPLFCVAPIADEHGTTATGFVNQMTDVRGIGTLVGAARGLFRARAVHGRVVVERAGNADTGQVFQIIEVSKASALIAARRGLFEVHAAEDGLAVERVGSGNVDFSRGTGAMMPVEGKGILVVAQNGVFWAHGKDGRVSLRRVSKRNVIVPSTDVNKVQEIRGVDAMIVGHNGVFWVHAHSSQMTVKSISNHAFGFGPSKSKPWVNIKGVGVLIDDDGLDWVHAGKGSVIVTRVRSSELGKVQKMIAIQGAGAVIDTYNNGLFLAHVASGKMIVRHVKNSSPHTVNGMVATQGAGGVLITTYSGALLWAHATNHGVKIEQVNHASHRSAEQLFRIPKIGTLIATDNGWFLAHAINGRLAIEKVSHGDHYVGYIWEMMRIPRVGALFRGDDGLFFARSIGGKLLVTEVDNADLTNLTGMFRIPKAGILISTGDNGLFMAQSVEDRLFLNHIGNTNLGRVDGKLRVPGIGVLIRTEHNGLFLAWPTGDGIAVTPAGDIDLGRMLETTEVSGAGTLIAGHNMKKVKRGELFETRLFQIIQLPSRSANVRLKYGTTGDSVDLDHDRVLRFSIQDFPCASALNQMGVEMRLTAPGRNTALITDPLHIQVLAKPHTAEVNVEVRLDEPGFWNFQLLTKFGGKTRLIGSPQALHVTMPQEGASWKLWLLPSLLAIGVIYAVVNLGLFVAARKWPRAWRIATDRGWIKTSLLRVATVLLTHSRWCQLWLLDLYFQQCKANAERNGDAGILDERFVDVNLSSISGKSEPSDKVTKTPWVAKRFWIQGNTGMGKTALFRHASKEHFVNYKNAFQAYRAYGCILVAFEARYFTGEHGRRDQPPWAWVLYGIKATLASANMPFEDDNLLKRILREGTVAVAIDGPDEAARGPAVIEFTRQYPKVPMLVTSQEEESARFEAWHLPSDIRNYADKLLREYLGQDTADTVRCAISASGLIDELRSGYDVRLLIDIVKKDVVDAPLPSSRLELYKEVVNAAWPHGTKSAIQEQQERTSAAAWAMVSKRAPSENMRRIRADEDLSAELLRALANVPDVKGKPVRLVRPAAGAFEFVHDQMHFYLAARWFTWPGRNVDEQIELISESLIRKHVFDRRKTLWKFVAGLLDDERLIELLTHLEQERKLKEHWYLLRVELESERDERNLNGFS